MRGEPVELFAQIRARGEHRDFLSDALFGKIRSRRQKLLQLLHHAVPQHMRLLQRERPRLSGENLDLRDLLLDHALELRAFAGARTRELFTECLVSLGAVKMDMDVFTVSRDDLEHLVGE